MSTTTTTLVTSGTPWHPQSFADLSKRLQSEPEAVSHDVDFTFQALAMRSQTQQTTITQINNIINGKGTVSSVALAMPSIFGVAGSPITTSGTLTVSLLAETANLVWAGPSSGAAAPPTFRALVAGDIPSLPYLPSSTVLPQTITKLAHQWLDSYSATTGLFTQSQPAIADLSDAANVVQTSRTISTTAPLTGGGDLSANRTLAVSLATSLAVGVVKPDGTTITVDGTGTISSVGGGVPTTRQINTTVPLTGGGDLSADRTLTISDFVGDTGTGGVKGAVPAPAAGDAAAGKFLKADGTWTAPAGSGTVTSVGLSLPADFTVTGSPVTTTGTLTGAWANESANVVHAGPASGAAAAPTWRALVAADLPVATSTAFGAVKPDNSSITISGGVISAAASVGSGVFYGADTGTANAWAATITGFTLAAGAVVGIKVANAVTGATTLAINGGAVKNVTKGGASLFALYAGDVLVNDVIWMVYDGTQYQVTNLRNSPSYTVPITASYTWVNQGTATSQDNTTYLKLAIPGVAASVNVRALAKAQPSTPYTVIAKLAYWQSAVNTNTIGIYFYDGTKIMGIEQLASTAATAGGSQARVQKYTNATSASTTLATENMVFPQSATFGAPIYLKFQNTGSVLNFFYSLDGFDYTQLGAEAIGTFITPTQIGFGGATAAATSAAVVQVLGFQSYAGTI